jgi:hypothetical protein
MQLSRIRLLVSREIAGELEAALAQEDLAVWRPSAALQPLAPEALLVVQLAIGRSGLALAGVIHAAGEAIARVVHARLGQVRLRTDDGDIPLEHLSAEQIGVLLATALPEG